MHEVLHYLLNIWHFMYVPSNSPWYQGSVWSNVFVILIVAPLGYLWSKTKYFPLKPIEHGIKHLHSKVDSLHDRHDKSDANQSDILASLKELHIKHDSLHAKYDNLHNRLDRHDILLQEAAQDDLTPESHPSPSE